MPDVSRACYTIPSMDYLVSTRYFIAHAICLQYAQAISSLSSQAESSIACFFFLISWRFSGFLRGCFQKTQNHTDVDWERPQSHLSGPNSLLLIQYIMSKIPARSNGCLFNKLLCCCFFNAESCIQPCAQMLMLKKFY